MSAWSWITLSPIILAYVVDHLEEHTRRFSWRPMNRKANEGNQQQ